MLFLLKLFAIFIIVHFIFSIKLLYVNGGLFNIDLERIILLEQSSNILKNCNVRVSKFNRTTTVINSEFDLNVELNDNHTVSVEMFYSATGSNQFDKTPFHIKTNLCNYMNTNYREHLMNGLKTVSNMPSGDILCPIEAKSYWIKNYSFELRDIKSGKSGLWRYDVSLLNDTVIIGGFQIFVRLTPVYSLRN